MESKKPIHEVRLGVIKGSVWVNESEFGEHFSVQVVRIYRDERGGWKFSSSFGRDDLLLVGKVCDMLHTWICMSSQPARCEVNRKCEG